MSVPDPTTSPPGNPRPQPVNPDTADPPKPQGAGQTSADLERHARLQKLIYNSSIAVCIACPLVALMPPRKLDLFTFGLGVAFCTSAGYALEQRTGRGLVWHISSQLPSVRRRERERLAREKEEEEAIGAKGEVGRRELLKKWKEEEDQKVRQRGFIKRIWMGGEGEDWVERRKEIEQEALDEGKGYGSLILQQVREVFRGKSDEEAEDDGDGGEDDDG